MIEIQHGEILFIVFYETYILGIGLKMDSIRVVYIISNQSFNDLLEVEPSRNMKKVDNQSSLIKRYTSGNCMLQSLEMSKCINVRICFDSRLSILCGYITSTSNGNMLLTHNKLK